MKQVRQKKSLRKTMKQKVLMKMKSLNFKKKLKSSLVNKKLSKLK